MTTQEFSKAAIDGFFYETLEKHSLPNMPGGTEIYQDAKYVWDTTIPERPKARVMYEFARLVGANFESLLPLACTSDLAMNAAMATDDIIDGCADRGGHQSLWKVRGTHPTIMVSTYLFELLHTILRENCPPSSSPEFIPYKGATGILEKYLLDMNQGQYFTTISRGSLRQFAVDDLRKLAELKAGGLFEFCCATPALFAGEFVDEAQIFGRGLGVFRQFLSDLHDFPDEADHEEPNWSSYKGSLRLEDLYSSQPNLILLLIGASNNLSSAEREDFYKLWEDGKLDPEDPEIAIFITDLAKKSEAVENAKEIIRGLMGNLRDIIVPLIADNSEVDLGWAFRGFR